MDSLTYRFSVLSETFAHGAYQTQNFNHPELRAPSVKGMIRWWHEALGFTPNDARTIFGQVSDRRNGIEGNSASRVAIRVRPGAETQTGRADFMPHKGHRGGSKSAIRPGSAFELTLISRREQLPSALGEQLQRATKAWLLLGAIGQRGNRAAGSVQWDQTPQSRKEFEIVTSQVLGNAQVRFAVLGENFQNREAEARHVAGDFLAAEAFRGESPFGSARPRKPSPLKLKCVELDGALRLLAVWDRRGESPDSLKRGVQTLVNANKRIGQLLEDVLPQLTA